MELHVSRARHYAGSALLAFLIVAPLSTAEPADQGTRAFHVFVGRYTRDTTGDSANPFKTDHEDNHVAGLAYAGDLRILGRRGAVGWETGAAARFAERRSIELWGGFFVRHRGLSLPGGLLVRPSLTLGLSAVDRAIGMEREREERRDGNARLLYYFGPELAFSLTRQPDWELYYRLHHRSGGMKTLGNMSEGHNANVFGIRRRF